MKPLRTLSLPLALLGAALLAACGGEEPDAYGNFEAREVTVSAEVAGRLLRFAAAEGERLPAGAVVGQIDTVPLGLQREEAGAQRAASLTRADEARAQLAVLGAQLATAREEHARVLRLYRAEAATAQQLTHAEGQVRVLREQIRAARARAGAVREEAGGAEARDRQIEERIARSRIVNPEPGTVLTTYAERGEYVQPGQPLYRIAALDTLTLRAYVTGSQLARVRVGQAVRVRVDAGPDRLLSLPGRVIWVSPEAEFTPTPIQTREERADQVYAVKIRVPNPDGVLKIGMPGEVLLAGGEEARPS